jgi:hypothetical protein
VSGLDQAVAVLDAEIGTLETQLTTKRDERRELQQTRTRLTKLGGNSSTAAAARGAAGRRAGTRTARSAAAASAAAAATTPRRTPRRSAARAPAAEREAAIIQAITSTPMTAVETAKAVGLSRPRARQILKQLRDSGRLRVEQVPSGRGRPQLVYHADSNRAASRADSRAGAAATAAASSSATPSSSSRRRSRRRPGTSSTKRPSGGGQTRARSAAAQAAPADPAAHTTN